MPKPATHYIGGKPGEALPVVTRPRRYGDVRDVLEKLPEWGGDGYAIMDLFTVRAALIAELDPAPRSVFEFGAYRGYFLVTACHAAPTINRVGWVDNESHTPDSNALCEANVRSLRPHAETWYRERPDESYLFGRADLVQVDGAHTYAHCLTDLIWAEQLGPHAIFVDDYEAISDVRRATEDFAAWRGFAVEEHETVNGLAVLRREPS